MRDQARATGSAQAVQLSSSSLPVRDGEDLELWLIGVDASGELTISTLGIIERDAGGTYEVPDDFDPSAFDTVLRLYSGNHLEASSVELNYVDDSCRAQSHITRTLYPGAYTLIVEGYSTREGTATSTLCSAFDRVSHLHHAPHMPHGDVSLGGREGGIEVLFCGCSYASLVRQ